MAGQDASRRNVAAFRSRPRNIYSHPHKRGMPLEGPLRKRISSLGVTSLHRNRGSKMPGNYPGQKDGLEILQKQRSADHCAGFLYGFMDGLGLNHRYRFIKLLGLNRKPDIIDI